MKLEMCGSTNYPPIPWMVLGNSEGGGGGVSNTKILYRDYSMQLNWISRGVTELN